MFSTPRRRSSAFFETLCSCNGVIRGLFTVVVTGLLVFCTSRPFIGADRANGNANALGVVDFSQVRKTADEVLVLRFGGSGTLELIDELAKEGIKPRATEIQLEHAIGVHFGLAARSVGLKRDIDIILNTHDPNSPDKDSEVITAPVYAAGQPVFHPDRVDLTAEICEEFRVSFAKWLRKSFQEFPEVKERLKTD